MNKIVLLILIILILGGVYVATRDEMSEPKDDMTEENMQDEMMDDEMEDKMSDDMDDMSDEMEQDDMMDDHMSEAGTYTTYSAEALASATTEHKVIFFKASWCPTCRALDADIIASLSDIPADVTIFEIDYDTSTELKTKYGVTVQHTLVAVDSEGNMLKKWTGSPTLESLVAAL